MGGGESAHIAFDPDDPTLVYATTINGTLTEYNHDNRKSRYIIPYPEFVFGMDSKDLKYRANWNPPVITSPHDHSTIYYGTQFLLKSTDRGLNWEEVSPDLTRNNPEHIGRNGGPLTPENVGAEFYGTILTITASPHAYGEVWVGSDDGLVHVTRDDGGEWTSAGQLPKRPMRQVLASVHDADVVYAAAGIRDILIANMIVGLGKNLGNCDFILPQSCHLVWHTNDTHPMPNWMTPR